MQRTFAYIILTLYLAIWSLAFAQNRVQVTGRVLNEATGQSGQPVPIPGLSVYLVNAEGQRLPPDEPTERIVTDLEGRFTISDVPLEAWYSIEVYSDVYARGALRFTDYIFVRETDVAPNNEGIETVELPDISLKLQRY